jgi:tRNA (guanine-N7-)-methyltransferase
MGRRALRKPDPTLDLAHHLKTIDDLPRPWMPEKIFGRSAPLEIEVGSGKGLFLRTTAPVRPETDFLGIEIVRKYAAFSAAGLAKRNIENAIVVAGDAIRTFKEILPAECAAAVHVYFPDPWWKKRHRKRRVMRDEFVKEIERVLEVGGRLHFWTDVGEYFESALETLAEATTLAGPFDVEEAAPEHDLDYRTHFERRTRLQREAVFRAEFEKRG